MSLIKMSLHSLPTHPTYNICALINNTFFKSIQKTPQISLDIYKVFDVARITIRNTMSHWVLALEIGKLSIIT